MAVKQGCPSLSKAGEQVEAQQRDRQKHGQILVKEIASRHAQMYAQEVLEAILEIYFKIGKPSIISLIVTEKTPTNQPVNLSTKKAQKTKPKPKLTKVLGRSESCGERCRKLRNLCSAEKPNPCQIPYAKLTRWREKREYNLYPIPVLHLLADLHETKPLPVPRDGVHLPNLP